MKTASWILLLVATLLLIFGSLASFGLAYFGAASDDPVTEQATIQDLAEGRNEVATALQGRRGTAAAFSAAFATLLLFVILGPYRGGSVWAWWAILCSQLVLAAMILSRILFLNTTRGAATGGILLAIVVVGLLLDARRLSSGRSA